MPNNFSNLDAAVAELLAQVQQTKGVQESAVTLINGFATLVEDKVRQALEDDDAADAGSIEAAVAAINTAKSDMLASTTALGDAVAANG
jgi:hypothetical protein